MMKTPPEFFKIKNVHYCYLIAFVLVLPALLINLGAMPLVADEPTRALVALEMYFSDNYIVPTINGEYYYNKPPLYNWLLAGLYHLTGQMNEWVIRFPTVFSILIFAFIIFVFVRKYTDTRTAVFTILAYITCGRVLFYDSFLGLIDTLFSALIFLNFMVLYQFDKKNEYAKLFLWSYLIMTVAYFLKGLPALVFEAISLLALAALRRKIRFLFSGYHFLGIGIFVLFLLAYYSQYLRYNTIDVLVKTLITESTKRTAAAHGAIESLLHLFSFPFEVVLHFLPWTAPLFLLLKRSSRRFILENDFLKYNLVMLLANIAVYWLSPETRPRYLFMFLPPVFILSFSLLTQESNLKFRTVMEKIFLFLLVLFVIAPLTIPFVPMIPAVGMKWGKVILLSLSMLLILLFYLQNNQERLFLFCIALLVARIGFDWFVFPSRLQTEPQVAYRSEAIKVGQFTKGQPMALYKYSAINHDISFYVSRERGGILYHAFGTPKKNIFYLTDIVDEELKTAKVYMQFRESYNNTMLYLVRIEQ